jgi:hypothetical protein
MATKKVKFQTNINGKLSCKAMVHVSAAPTGSIRETVLESAIIEIHTMDNSCDPTFWKLDDLCRVSLGSLQNCFTWPSHGMDTFDFIQQFKQENPNADADTPMAVYFYHKIENYVTTN